MPSLFSLAGGVWNVTRSQNKEGVLQLEYKGQPFWGKKVLFFRPFLTTLLTFRGGFYLGGGIAFDIHAGKHLCFTPSFGSGYYARGGSKDLGYPVENRSAFEVAWRFRGESRLGVQFYHLSNGTIAKRNPGVEVLVLQYSIPIFINN